MAFNFSSTAGTSGITSITLSATSSTELYNIIENFTLANESNHSLLMPVVQKAYSPSQSYINLIPSAITWPSSGGYETIQVQTNENWSWDMDEWLSPSVNGGMSGNTIIPIMASENTGNTRTGVIKAVCLSDSSITASTSVEQAGNYVKPYIELGYYMYMATPESASTAVTVSSNIDWYTMTDSRWITLNTVSGSGDGSVSFAIDANTTEFNREGTITLFNYDYDIYIDLVVRQTSSVKPFIILDPYSFIVEPTGSTGNLISVSANCDYDIDTDVDWITVDSESGSGYGSVSFSTAPSDRILSNVGNIVFSNSAVSSYVSVERKSVEKYLSASTTSLYFDEENPEPVEVNVYSNTSWIVVFDEGETRSWINVTPMSGNGNTVIKVRVTEGVFRKGAILLHNVENGLSWKIDVIQKDFNAIYYTTNNEQVLWPSYYTTWPFYKYFKDSNNEYVDIDTNTYENGIGKMTFEGVVVRIIEDSYNGAFESSATLTSISFPNSITRLAKETLSDCTNLEKVDLPTGLTENAYFLGCSSLKDVTIPDTVTGICFTDCTGLTHTNIPVSLTDLPQYCFLNCVSLTGVTLPENLTDIQYNAFNNCTGLTDLTLNSKLHNIGNQAFYGCSGLTALTISDGETQLNIGIDSFSNTGLKVIYSYATTAPGIQLGPHYDKPNSFHNIPTGGTVHYPSGADYHTFEYIFTSDNPTWTFIDDL